MNNSVLDQFPSFEEFKDDILKYQDTDGNVIEKVSKLYGKIPLFIRVLHNFDPTGAFSALNEVVSEKTDAQEKDRILRAIYDLAIKIWNIENLALENLSDEKLQFLCLVYNFTQTDRRVSVGPDELQNALEISQQRLISIAQYLHKAGLIYFNTLVEGIKILHKGVIQVEVELLVRKRIPYFVQEIELQRIEEKIKTRYSILQKVYEETGDDTFKKIQHVQLAEQLGINHLQLLSEYLPYLQDEGLILCRTNDSITITEDGIDKLKALKL